MEPSFRRAVQVITDRAESSRTEDRQRLETVFGGLLAKADIKRLTDDARKNARLTVNFHPDRRDKRGITVAEGLVTSGHYLSQFETGISNGGRFAVPGGDRVRWEQDLFGTIYDTGIETRPIYGALDITNDPHGGSPRFGSSYIVLRSHCLDRATFCVGDSHVGPTDVGTMASFNSILAGMFEGCTHGEGLDRSLSVADLRLAIESGDPPAEPARALDGYVEAQVHGGISIADDVAEIVLDPSFRRTPTEAHLHRYCANSDIELCWHEGSEIAAAQIPLDFRGPEMGPLATEIARRDGMVDAAAIGQSARKIAYTPPSPLGDLPNSPLQQHKYLWHCLLKFGSRAVTKP